jgi:hypothetical protein
MKRHPAIAATLAFFFLLAWQARAQENLPKLVKKIQPAVVTVIAYDAKGKPIGQGSGFFINVEGYFITNYHVLAGASHGRIKTIDGETYPIEKIVAEDRSGDLVIAVTNDPFIAIGRGSLKFSAVMPEVGERVVVVGSPLGLEQTLSDGVVSSVRKITDFGEILQITAPISSGSSGSPVVNMKGDVIGVATLQMVKGQNLNFAVPGNWALALQQRTAKAISPPPIVEKKPDLPVNEPEGTAKDFFNQGRALFKAEQYEKAVSALEQAIKIKPDFAQAYYILGWAYNKLRRYQEAAEAFRQAIKNKPDYVLAYAGQGWTFNQLGRYQESVELCKQAIRLKQNFSDAHYSLGVAYLALGHKGAAIEEYKRLQKLDPKLAEELFEKIYK